MTRFWITLEQGVRLRAPVPRARCTAARSSCRRSRACTIMRPRRGHRARLRRSRSIGIRPGEKLHEMLITEDEARHTVELDDMFVILPVSPTGGEAAGRTARALPDGFRYASDTNAQQLTLKPLSRAPRTTGDDATTRSRSTAAGRSGRRCCPTAGRRSRRPTSTAVVAALRSDWLTTGPAVDEFERAFAEARRRAPRGRRQQRHRRAPRRARSRPASDRATRRYAPA